MLSGIMLSFCDCLFVCVSVIHHYCINMNAMIELFLHLGYPLFITCIHCVLGKLTISKIYTIRVEMSTLLSVMQNFVKISKEL